MNHTHDVELFKNIERRARAELIPKLRVGPKRAFTLHSIINAILNLVYPKDKKDSYLNNFTTTIGYTVALATAYGVKDFTNWETLCHEVKHAQQAKKWTRLLFGYLYLWPISQGVVFLLLGWIGLIWVSGWVFWAYLGGWLVLTGLHFIPQWPDPWRKHWELQGYSISMHLHHLVWKNVSASYRQHVATNFHSMAYFIMEPNKQKITDQLDVIATQIEMGKSPVANEPIVKIAEEEYAKLYGKS